MNLNSMAGKQQMKWNKILTSYKIKTNNSIHTSICTHMYVCTIYKIRYYKHI